MTVWCRHEEQPSVRQRTPAKRPSLPLQDLTTCRPNDSQQAGETLLPPKLEGFIERYGLHTAAEGWIFWGWLSPAWIEDHGQTLTAVFEQGSISGAVLLGHYPRRDLRNRGSGVCLFLPTTQPHLGKLLRIELEYKKMMGSIALSDALREIPNNVLPSHAEGILKLVPQTAQVTALREALERRVVANGFVDYYGYHPPSAGWMICGWGLRELDQRGACARQHHAAV